MASALDKHFRMTLNPPKQGKRRVNKDGTKYAGNPHKDASQDEAKPAGSGEPATAD